jgi:uncharacterized protein YqeY
MLKEKLQADVKEALKAGDSKKRTVLSSLLSAIKNRELDKRGKLMKAGATGDVEQASQLTDEEAIEVISSEIKKRKESIETYTAAGRPELAEQEKEELATLMHYMPEQISEDEIRTEVKSIIEAVHPQGPKDMGKVIGAVMPKVKGRADGQVVSRIVKEELEKLS